MTWKSNFRIHLLVGFDGLEKDVSRFRARTTGAKPMAPPPPMIPPASSAVQNPRMLRTSSLTAKPWRAPVQTCFRQPHPVSLPSSLIPHRARWSSLSSCCMGMCWVDHAELQSFCVNFLDQLRAARAHKLLNQSVGPIQDNSP